VTLPPRRILYAALAMVALAGAGVAVALALRDAPADSAGFDPALGERVSFGAPALSQNSPLSGTSAPRTGTTTAGGAGSTPAPAASPAPASAPPSRSGEEATAERQRFLRDGPEAAISNRRAMEEAVARVAAALSAQDAAALSVMAAPPAELAADAARIEVLAASYPTFLSSRMSPNVNVFSSATATAYTSYAVVTWKDAGIVSEHTVPVTLRIVDGMWHLTTRGETDPGLRFVRSVVP